MKLPQLEKKPEIKSCHNKSWTDDYSWIHQPNILEVLRDSSKLLPEVRKYLEDENEYFSDQMKDTKKIQKKLFDEIKARIKHFVSKRCLDIEGLGEKLIDQLVDKKIINDFSQIFNINHKQLSNLDRMADKSAENIINAIQSKKTTSMWLSLIHI